MRPIRDIFRSHAVLDGDGRHVNGTDKESNHRYGAAYELILGTMRTQASLVMEVGVADGSSLLAWREVFPYAHCVGLDIMPDPAARLAGEERVEFVRGDATRREDCERAAAGRAFDLIVDDATHLLEDVLRTLFWLWRYVRPGGLYIVEDGGFQDSARAVELLGAEVVLTRGPFGGDEPLLVLRKPR